MPFNQPSVTKRGSSREDRDPTITRVPKSARRATIGKPPDGERPGTGLRSNRHETFPLLEQSLCFDELVDFHASTDFVLVRAFLLTH
ncbi:MAG: hypothetical protein JWM32_662 [Verrucomicrobia bacterium]|nr:hypothetical protein [Verrucomicrobiota bacterium]